MNTSGGGDAHQFERPINERLKKKALKSNGPKFKPRNYQRELYEKALNQNTIIYLGTGLGKTFIIVMYLNEPSVYQQINLGRKAVFLAPTQDLVLQQAEYISEQVGFKTKIFCGRSRHVGLHIDVWKPDTWELELEDVDILFMTPQILLNAISTSCLKWVQFSVIFFDECHHGTKPKSGKAGSQYYQLMRNFDNYHSKHPTDIQPRIIGLTASLINNMPKNRLNIIDQVRSLEQVFKSICVTEIKAQTERPKMIFQPFVRTIISDSINTAIKSITERLTNALKLKDKDPLNLRIGKPSEEQIQAISFQNKLALAAAGFSIKPTSFPKVLDALSLVHQRCGLWALLTTCDKLAAAIDRHKSAGVFLRRDISTIYDLFGNLLTTLSGSVKEFLARHPSYESLYVRPKAKTLLSVLKLEYERTQEEIQSRGEELAKTFSSIIFVQSRLEVTAINSWLQRITETSQEYDFLKPDYAIGLAATASSKYSCITKRKPSEQAKMLDNFRKSNLNVIVTTSVLEEGIDLPTCSTVIRYDEPKNFREYVQSRGRARQKISSFILMSPEDSMKDNLDRMNKFNDFECTVGEAFANFTLGAGAPAIPRTTNHTNQSGYGNEYSEDFFNLDDFRIQITPSVASTILHMYCSRLSKGTPFAGNVQFERSQPTPTTFQTTLFLPSGSPITEAVIGSVKVSIKLADGSAIVAAIRKLYELGEINENAIPARASESNIEELLSKSNLSLPMKNLIGEQTGVIMSENDRDVHYFKPKHLSIDRNLMFNCANRPYRFVKVHFEPDLTDSREDTRKFYDIPKHSLILDQHVSEETLPKVVIGHYGKLNVKYQFVDIMNIQRAPDHESITDYMLKLFQFGLLIPGIERRLFKTRCLAYTVPIEATNDTVRPDLDKMSRSFRLNQFPQDRLRIPGSLFRPNDIVRLSRYYAQGIRANGLFLVKRVRNDMTLHDKMPGRSITFLQDAEEKYGQGVVQSAHMNQPIIEVMPISSGLSELREQKRARMADYQTRSQFYMDQMLDYVDYDPWSLLQAQSIPVILFKAYQATIAQGLEDELNAATGCKRFTDNVANPAIFLKDLELDHTIERQWAKEDGHNDGDAMETGALEPIVDDNMDIGLEEDSDEEIEFSSDDDQNDDNEEHTAEDYMSDDSSSGGPSSALTLSEEKQFYNDMISKGKLNLSNDDDPEDKFKPWDMNEYKEADLKTLQIEHRQLATHASYDYEANPDYRIHFCDLPSQLCPTTNKLCDLLKDLEFAAKSDNFLDSDLKDDDKRRNAKVDLNIKANITFDNFNKPMVVSESTQDHKVGLMEALTLKSAQESYDLESLENLGDSFLKYMVSVLLYRKLEAHEGFLTSARSQLVSNKRFQNLAMSKNLGSYAIRTSFTKDQFALMVGRPVSNPAELKNYCSKLRPKDLADMFEAIVGYYLAVESQSKSLMAMEWMGLDLFTNNLFETGDQESLRFKSFETSMIVEGNEALKQYAACKAKMVSFENIIGYTFKDKSHLIQAFTHASYINKCTRSYERMEFLGDAILDFLVSTTLFNSAQIAKTPGQLTSSRSAVVNNVAFSKLSVKYRFDMFALYFEHELYDELARCRLARNDDPELKFFDMIEYDSIVKFLADLFESVAGAIYIDSGGSLDAVWKSYYPMMKENIDNELASPSKNLVSLLHEKFPGRDRVLFDFREEKIGHEIQFRAICLIKDYAAFDGVGQTRHQAKQRAVQEACENLPKPEKLLELNRQFEARNPKPNRGAPNKRRHGGRGRGTGPRHGSRSERPHSGHAGSRGSSRASSRVSSSQSRGGGRSNYSRR